MNRETPIDLLFAGMAKLGPGGDVYTRHVLSLIPARRFRLVVDAGCGTGRQTLVLAKALGTLIHAIDSHAPFLEELLRRARQAGVAHLVQPHCMNIKDIPGVFPHIDLIWSEGAAYRIGFSNALTTWASAICPEGLAVVGELSWLREEVPDPIRAFFLSVYPDISSIPENIATANAAGFDLLATYTLPSEAWLEGYYDVLGPRAKALLDHPEPTVRGIAVQTIQEIEAFERSEGSYGYVFYVLQRVRDVA